MVVVVVRYGINFSRCEAVSVIGILEGGVGVGQKWKNRRKGCKKDLRNQRSLFFFVAKILGLGPLPICRTRFPSTSKSRFAITREVRPGSF